MSSAPGVFVERVSMYACDYADLSIIGTTPLHAPAVKTHERERVGLIMENSCKQLASKKPVVLVTEEDMRWITETWVHRFEHCATEEDGSAFTDMLFVARCFVMCCNFPRCREMSSFTDIHELYTRVQLAGCNHTRAKFEKQISHAEMVTLEQRCASLVVYCLQANTVEQLLKQLGTRPLPDIDDHLQDEMTPLRKVPDLIPPTAAELAAEAEQEEEERKRQKNNERRMRMDAQRIKDAEEEKGEIEEEDQGVQLDVNEGQYWHSDKGTVIKDFTRMASRIFRNYWLQWGIFNKYPIRPIEHQPRYDPQALEHFNNWLADSTKRKANDGSDKEFHNMVFEFWMPDGGRQELMRSFETKFDFLPSINLLEKQLGVDSTTAIARMARTIPSEIIADPKHDLYDFTVIAQFNYHMEHETEVEFVKNYVIMPGDLNKLRARLDCEKTWGLPRRPILLRIMRGWYIHDIRRVSTQVGQPIKCVKEWIPCSGTKDALMKIMTLWGGPYLKMMANYIKVGAWIDQLTSGIKDD